MRNAPKAYAAIILIVLMVGCTTPPVRRVALLAPFEGRHREIGYQALYAARMAIAEAEQPHLELLAVDDGGTLTTAQDRARALNNDPLVEAVLLLGPYPTDQTTVDLLRDNLQTLVIGDWTGDFNALLEANTPTPCADLCQLTVFATTAENPSAIIVETTAPPVTDDFSARYTAFDQFAPPPLPIAHLTYRVTANWLQGVPYIPSTYTYTYSADGTLQHQP